MTGALDLAQVTLIGEALAAAPVAVFVWDEDRNYAAVNDAACSLVGLSRDELLRTKVGDLTPDGAAPHFDEVQRRKWLVGSLTFTRTDGVPVELEWVTFQTTLAGLPYMASLCWPV